MGATARQAVTVPQGRIVRGQNRTRTPNDGIRGKPAVGLSTMRGVVPPGSCAKLASSATGLSRFSRLITSTYRDQRPDAPPGWWAIRRSTRA